MTPSIGRIVHFVLDNEAHRAAIITNVHTDGRINLEIFFDAGNDDMTEKVRPWRANVSEGVPSEQANFYPKGTWHWPEQSKD